MLGFIATFAAGVVLWTFLEYSLHRWAFHGRKLGKKVAREHLDHHAKVDYFAPWATKIAMAAPILAGITALAVLAMGAPGAGVTLGVFSGWLIYELIHRRIHVAAPGNAYARWARAHHLSHHFGKSHANHGVTSPIWDHVFGTFEAPGVIIVPRRHAGKFPWLVEERDGKAAVRADFAMGYRVV